MITRDAKIGLLVVLAFCLIVGILLSEHLAYDPLLCAALADRVREAG